MEELVPKLSTARTY